MFQSSWSSSSSGVYCVQKLKKGTKCKFLQALTNDVKYKLQLKCHKSLHFTLSFKFLYKINTWRWLAWLKHGVGGNDK